VGRRLRREYPLCPRGEQLVRTRAAAVADPPLLEPLGRGAVLPRLAGRARHGRLCACVSAQDVARHGGRGGSRLARLVDPRNPELARRCLLLDLRPGLGAGARRGDRNRAAETGTPPACPARLARARGRRGRGRLLLERDAVSGIRGPAACSGRGVPDRGRRFAGPALARAAARDGPAPLRRRPLVRLLPLALAGAGHRRAVRRTRARPRDEAPAPAGSVRAIDCELPACREPDSPAPSERAGWCAAVARVRGSRARDVARDPPLDRSDRPAARGRRGSGEASRARRDGVGGDCRAREAASCRRRGRPRRRARGPAAPRR
jgi:hypothetical protein